MECKKPENAAKCSCISLDCERRGTCCDCLASHLARKSLPRCCFPAEPKDPPSRSFAGFAKAWNT